MYHPAFNRLLNNFIAAGCELPLDKIVSDRFEAQQRSAKSRDTTLRPRVDTGRLELAVTPASAGDLSERTLLQSHDAEAKARR